MTPGFTPRRDRENRKARRNSSMARPRYHRPWGDQDALGLPPDHPSDRGRKRLLVIGQSQVAGHRPVGVLVARDLGDDPQMPGQPGRLEILDQVGQDQGPAGAVKEHRLAVHPRACNDHLLHVRRPGRGRRIAKAVIGPETHPLPLGTRLNPRCDPCRRAGQGIGPILQVGIVQPVRRDEVPDRAKLLQILQKDRPKNAMGECSHNAPRSQPDHRHPRRERHPVKVDLGAVGDPDLARDRLQREERRICPTRRHRVTRPARPRGPARSGPWSPRSRKAR